MKRFDWRCLAVSSVLLAVFAAHAETRPQYGGTLHVAVQAAIASLDPADSGTDSFARRHIAQLMFENLVTTDDSGRAHAALTTSWQASAGNQRWRFVLRRGVKFHDG